MKKMMARKYTAVFAVAVLAMVLAGCGSGSNPTKNPEKEAEKEMEEQKDYLEPELDSPNTWNSEYDSETKTMILNKGFGNAVFPFQYGQPVDASEYSYAELTYSDLSLPQVAFIVTYNDKSFSTAYLQPYTDKVYIKLDDSKKDKVSSFSVKSTMYNGYSEDSVSVKFESFRFVKEKPGIEKTTEKDKETGDFDDSVSGMELAEKIAVGWNIGRTATCPYYNSTDLEYMTYGDQEDYIPVLDDEGEYTYDESGIKCSSKVLGTNAMGFNLESSLLLPETDDFIHAGYANGLKSIRINVTWFAHIIDENYTINPYWMERVKHLVDCAISDGYYVILNDHHSVYKYMKSPIGYACGYNVREEDKEESERYLKAIWTQIAETFNGSYDEHLIFETLNEPRKACSYDEDSNGERWPYSLSSDEKTSLTAILNEYNQVIVDAIRKTGGNNAKRFIMIPTYATDVEMLFDCGYELPEDSAENRLMVALHWYPMLAYSSNGIYDYSSTNLKQQFVAKFSKIYAEYIAKGIPVCITEVNVPNLGEYRKPYSDDTIYNCLYDFCRTAGSYKICLTLWDDGIVHGVINRNAPYEPVETFLPDLIDAWNTSEEGGKTPEILFAENESDAVSLIDSSVELTDWSDKYSCCTVSASKVEGLKEGSIIKMCFSDTDTDGFKNFAFHNGSDGWYKIAFTGTVYSEKAYVNEDNFNFNGAVSDIYIVLSADDAAALKDGFVLHGMNVVISDIKVIF